MSCEGVKPIDGTKVKGSMMNHSMNQWTTSARRACILLLLFLCSSSKAACNTTACFDDLPISSESLLALTLSGIPNDINDTDIELLKTAVTDNFECSDNLRNVTNVLFRPDLSVDLTSSVNGTYSLVYEVDWITNICQNSFFEDQSFNESNTNRLRQLRSSSRSSYTTTQNHIRNRLQKNFLATTNRDLQECNCTVPSSEDFLDEIKSSYLAANNKSITGISDFVNIQETEEIENCNNTRTTWSGSAAWTVSVDLSSATEEFIQALEEAALEVFNSWDDTCDKSSRRVESVEVNIRPVINANLQVDDDGRRNREFRWLQSQRFPIRIIEIESNSTSSSDTNTSESPSLSPTDSPTASPTSQGADLFTIVFTIQGSCFNCRSDLQLFDQISDPARLLNVADALARVHTESSARRLDTSTVCVCPGGLERRGQTANEFLSRLQLQLANASDPLLASLAGEDGAFAEVKPIGCGLFNEFLSIARVDFATNGGGMVDLTEAEKQLLGQGFVSTYNGLQGQRCDRFFRILESAEVVGTINGGPGGVVEGNMGRLLQTNETPIVNITVGSGGNISLDDLTDEPSLSPTLSPTSSPTSQGADLVTLVFLTTGSCAGCPSEFNLFNQLTSGRKLAKAAKTDVGLTGDALFPELNFERLLEEQDEGKCFCQLADEEREPDAEEFVIEFSFLVEELSEEGSLSSNITGALAVEQTTGTPSTMPSSEPSVGPSLSLEPSPVLSFSPSLPSPSVEPSELPSSSPSVPSEFPSLFPSEFPSDFASAFPSNEPTVAPSKNPTPSPSKNPTPSPSKKPTLAPTARTNQPSAAPSSEPSIEPSNAPSRAPSTSPSVSPTSSPSDSPSSDPTDEPTSSPSDSPSADPTGKPTVTPSLSPSDSPSFSPSGSPTIACAATPVVKLPADFDDQILGTPSLLAAPDQGPGTPEADAVCIDQELPMALRENRIRLISGDSENALVRVQSCGNTVAFQDTVGTTRPRATLLQFLERTSILDGTCVENCVISSVQCDQFNTAGTVVLPNEDSDESVIVESYRVPLPYFACKLRLIGDTTTSLGPNPSETPVEIIGTPEGAFVQGFTTCDDTLRLAEAEVDLFEVEDADDQFLVFRCPSQGFEYQIYFSSAGCAELLFGDGNVPANDSRCLRFTCPGNFEVSFDLSQLDPSVQEVVVYGLLERT